MVSCKMNLGKEGVEGLNRAFNDSHFSARENRNKTDYNVEVFYEMDDKRTPIIFYDGNILVVYDAVVNGLPREVQDDIKGRLFGIKSLDRMIMFDFWDRIRQSY